MLLPNQLKKCSANSFKLLKSTKVTEKKNGVYHEAHEDIRNVSHSLRYILHTTAHSRFHATLSYNVMTLFIPFHRVSFNALTR